MPAFCPLCASDDHTSTYRTEDGISYAVCSDVLHGAGGYTWEPWSPTRVRAGGDGIGAQLGIWDKLLECVPVDVEFVPYGDVEDTFIERYPADADELLRRYGHRWRDPANRSGHYSMSVYLATRLRDLVGEGQLEVKWLPATGQWAYNGIISHWRRLVPGGHGATSAE